MHTAIKRVVQDAELADLTLPKSLLARHTLLETFPIQLPDGDQWVGTLWKTPTRMNGRRIQVTDRQGTGLFDTDDCFDLANAVNSLQLWLGEQVAERKVRPIGRLRLAEAG